MAEATKRSPSPTPITSGHSRRDATSRPGSVDVRGHEGEVAAQAREHRRTAATRSPRYSRAMSCGTTSVSVSEAKTTPRFWSSERSSV